jgi:hypothetical protein
MENIAAVLAFKINANDSEFGGIFMSIRHEEQNIDPEIQFKLYYGGNCSEAILPDPADIYIKKETPPLEFNKDLCDFIKTSKK